MYTSGTTGEPKGVEITHEAILSSTGALFLLMKQLGVKVG
jgi:long-subunit acyl-CoA synthetase (AMP-forming)